MTAPRSALARLSLVAAAALLAGCTMCPNPFDYAGPVPNGSPPQTDFRARSQGIIPIGATPRPWPPLVQDDAADDEPVVASAEEPAVVPVIAEADAGVRRER